MIKPARTSWSSFFRGRDSAEKKFLAGTISPLVLYLAFWTLFPMLWGVALAFFDYSPRRAGGFLGFGGDNPYIGVQHFQNMTDFSTSAALEVQQFHTAVKITLMFAALVVPLNLLLTLPLAFLIESVHGRRPRASSAPFSSCQCWRLRWVSLSCGDSYSIRSAAC